MAGGSVQVPPQGLAPCPPPPASIPGGATRWRLAAPPGLHLPACPARRPERCAKWPPASPPAPTTPGTPRAAAGQLAASAAHRAALGWGRVPRGPAGSGSDLTSGGAAALGGERGGGAGGGEDAARGGAQRGGGGGGSELGGRTRGLPIPSPDPRSR